MPACVVAVDADEAALVACVEAVDAEEEAFVSDVAASLALVVAIPA